ncbi:hypothetical protein [Bradyrhizobium sp. STM 3809]|uniref:hypothetical protein n=1 Tax=Bradyrhizobium sp. STM 3809 TaxID=551936 RepID=UPI001111BBD3|nr:hypothetical protein [Bradyrhizobium sp. STM 3809]
MSLSAISSQPTTAVQTTNSQADFRQSFNQLVSALNSGSLNDAQQAYSALSQLQSSGQGPSSNSNTPFARALSQIGQDLQNGDLSGAQQALASLKSHGGHHHGHRGGGTDSSATSVVASTTASSATGSLPSSNGVDITT